MDSESQDILRQLITQQRVASLGTLWQGGPFVSMVMFAAATDFSEFYIHISRLALHTKNIARDARVSLMIAEPEQDSKNPQTLARLSIAGTARPIAPDEAGYETAKSAYLTKYSAAAFNFQLGDFVLYAIQPQTARLVAGFGRIFDLSAADISRVAEQ